MINPVPKPVKTKKKSFPAKRKAKSPLRKLIETIDSLDSSACLIRNRFICWGCGNRAQYNHHFFHKSSHGAVRFDPHNHCPLCFACHQFKIHTKGDTEDLRDRLINEIGESNFESLKGKSRELADRKQSTLEQILEQKARYLLMLFNTYPDRIPMLSDAAYKRAIRVFAKLFANFKLPLTNEKSCIN